MPPDVTTTMIDTPCCTSSHSGCGVSVLGEFHVMISDGAYLHGDSDRALGIVHWVLDFQQAQGSCQTVWKTNCPQMKHLISSPDESIHDVEVIIDVHTSLGVVICMGVGACEYGWGLASPHPPTHRATHRHPCGCGIQSFNLQVPNHHYTTKCYKCTEVHA